MLSTNNCINGRNWFTLHKIEGRKREYLVDSKNNLCPFTTSDEALWEIENKLEAYQFMQDKPGIVTLKIVNKTQLSEQDLSQLKETFYRIYKNMELIIRIVENIPRTPSGKFVLLEQKLLV
jgi:phenylacetate-coenzyme A ligase PaaK-like adenylate-forming protein